MFCSKQTCLVWGHRRGLQRLLSSGEGEERDEGKRKDEETTEEERRRVGASQYLGRIAIRPQVDVNAVDWQNRCRNAHVVGEQR